MNSKRSQLGTGKRLAETGMSLGQKRAEREDKRIGDVDSNTTKGLTTRLMISYVNDRVHSESRVECAKERIELNELCRPRLIGD